MSHFALKLLLVVALEHLQKLSCSDAIQVALEELKVFVVQVLVVQLLLFGCQLFASVLLNEPVWVLVADSSRDFKFGVLVGLLLVLLALSRLFVLSLLGFFRDHWWGKGVLLLGLWL